MAVKIYHGDILFTPSADRLEIHENSYIIVEEGVVSQICEKLPEQYQGAEVVDYGDKLIIPAFSDLHVHGAQYVQRGIGMDCLLSDWLNHYTFPQESRFQNMEYAKNCYDAFVDDMLRHGTFHANVSSKSLQTADPCSLPKKRNFLFFRNKNPAPVLALDPYRGA